MKRMIQLAEAIPKKGIAVNKTKAPLKANLVVELKEVKEKFNKLQEENNKNIESLQQEKDAHEETKSNNLETIKQLKEKLIT